MTVNDQSAKAIAVTVNGTEYNQTVPVRLTLADFLRHSIDLTGTHVGCEHGVCGACTVLVDGLAVRSCLMLAVQANQKTVVTVEGLADAQGQLSPLQRAFETQHALQCGFCTPGILTTLTEVLQENPEPTEEDIRGAISGNICRCTGYQNIVDAALSAAKIMRERPPG